MQTTKNTYPRISNVSPTQITSKAKQPVSGEKTPPGLNVSRSNKNICRNSKITNLYKNLREPNSFKVPSHSILQSQRGNTHRTRSNISGKSGISRNSGEGVSNFKQKSGSQENVSVSPRVTNISTLNQNLNEK